MLELAQLKPAAWREYQALRLAALAEAPYAFGTRLAEARLMGVADVQARLAERVHFVVRHRGQAVGLVGTAVDEGAELVSLWVSPGWRGQGVGDLLVRAVLDWARARGYPAVQLWVSEGNTAAERLYARHGFVRTGRSQPVRDDEPTRREVAMVRRLRGDTQ